MIGITYCPFIDPYTCITLVYQPMRSPKFSSTLLAIAGLAIIGIACDAAGGTDGGAAPSADATARSQATFDANFGSDWPDTDFARFTVGPGDFLVGAPKNGIRALTDPPYDDIQTSDDLLDDREPVIAVEIDGDARAFPLSILTRHEIANTTVGGVALAVTFCPLCNSAIVYDRTVAGTVHEFAVSGLLRNSDLVMYDLQTETWWQQFTGDAIVGELTGTVLDVRPSSIVSWADFKAGYPDGQALSFDTGYQYNYGFNPYISYDSGDRPFLFRGEFDERLSPLERVVGIELDGEEIAYPFALLESRRVVEDTVAGERIVIFHQPGTASALDTGFVRDGRDVGASGVFRPLADGRALTFRADRDSIFDIETGSRWNVLGHAVEGALTGVALEPVVHGDHFWFAWAAFHPKTQVFAE